MWRSDGRLIGIVGSDPSHVYAGSEGGAVFALDAETLSVKWRAELGGEIASDALSLDGGIAIVTNTVGPASTDGGSSRLRLLSRDSGVILWTGRLPRADKFFLGRGIGGTLVAVSSSGSFSILDGSSGAVRKEISGMGTLTTAASFWGERLVFANAERKLVVLDSSNGEVLVKSQLEHAVTALSFGQGGTLAVGDERGNLFLLSGVNGDIVWRFKSGGAISSVKGTGEGVFITSLDNFVYRLSNYNGDVVWKRRLPGRVTSSGIFVQSDFVVPVYGENAAYVIQEEKGKIVSVVAPSDDELLNRTPVQVSNTFFALSGSNTIRTASAAGCSNN